MARIRKKGTGPIILVVLLGVLLTAHSALALDVEPAMNVYYFTSDKDKLSKAQTESSEGDALQFHSPRDPRAIARDLAFDEIQHGNVCLTQAERDLKEAIRTKKVLQLCHRLYKEDVAGSVKRATEKKLKAEYTRCSANVEARENGESIRMVLSFRAQVVMHDRIPSSLKRAGFREEAMGWALPVREAPLGEAATGWKGVLKNGSCSLSKEALDTFLDRYLAQLHEAKALAYCRNSQMRMVEYVSSLQKQFKQYVPDEWLRNTGSGPSSEELLKPVPIVDSLATLKECKEYRQATAWQLKELRRLSSRMADEHDIPALDPANTPGSRGLASEDLD